jgi:hypothetical protein
MSSLADDIARLLQSQDQDGRERYSTEQLLLFGGLMVLAHAQQTGQQSFDVTETFLLQRMMSIAGVSLQWPPERQAEALQSYLAAHPLPADLQQGVARVNREHLAQSGAEASREAYQRFFGQPKNRAALAATVNEADTIPAGPMARFLLRQGANDKSRDG